MRNQRGDTLVEVLLAIVILGLVIVGSITIMTRGLATGQLALEHSQVRQGISSQIQMLQVLRDQYSSDPGSINAAEWAAIVASADENPINYDSTCTVTSTKTGKAFYVSNIGSQIKKQAFDPLAKPSSIATPGQGMWIETVRSHEDSVDTANSIRPAYIDFVVRACWQGSGSSLQQQTVTGIRLYDPSRN